jgi:hypothetical protein
LQSFIGEKWNMKRYIPFLFIAFVLFVVGGDQVLPGELGKYSIQTREALNDFALNLFPSTIKKPKNPYERTEKQIEEMQRKR